MNLRDKMREPLKAFITYESSDKILKEIKAHAEKHYKQKHTDKQYLIFMNKNECTFDKRSGQCQNYPYPWGLFTIPSQHVQGDCIEECLDKAMEKT